MTSTHSSYCRVDALSELFVGFKLCVYKLAQVLHQLRLGLQLVSFAGSEILCDHMVRNLLEFLWIWLVADRRVPREGVAFALLQT